MEILLGWKSIKSFTSRVKDSDRVESSGKDTPLPLSERILATKSALGGLAKKERELFHAIGKFRLKGLKEPCELWLYEMSYPGGSEGQRVDG